jgi:mannose-6-phosphate isomerase-like protein (cupin superfamily)
VTVEGRTWSNPRTGAWLRYGTEGADGVLERVMKAHTGMADAHLHLDYVERFQVLEGTATVELEGEKLTVGAGESVEVPRGAAHRNPYNATDADLHLLHVASPAGAFAEAFVSALGHHMENDTVDEQGEFSTLQLFVVLRGTRAQSYRAGIPIPLQKPVIAVGALVGRLRGLKPSYG